MASHIPFVNGDLDCTLVKQFYSDSGILRLPLEKADRLVPKLPAGPTIWVDAGIDGLHQPVDKSANTAWKTHIRQFPGHDVITDADFQSKPDSGQIQDFVDAALNACVRFHPTAITVPQLPLVTDSTRNKINKVLATATAKWKTTASYRGHLILPVIFTDQRQLNLKNPRRNKRGVILACYDKSQADELWAVDSTLSDQDGSRPLHDRRFKGLVDFHEEIAKELPGKARVIAGPYWGMNLTLWVKGLCRFPAIGVGSAYQYYLSSGLPRQPVTRLAIPPLCRWVRTKDLRDWLSKAMTQIDKSEPTYSVFAELKSKFDTLDTRDTSRRQIAKFYKEWFDRIEQVPPAGRALALYQMFSSAYVLGKNLPALSASERTARRPERVAEYLMLSCL